jgi:uncharacterized coiled-coil protein SlyX
MKSAIILNNTVKESAKDIPQVRKQLNTAVEVVKDHQNPNLEVLELRIPPNPDQRLFFVFFAIG